MRLSKEVAAVVAGGGSGMGEATARALAGRGVRVAILDWDRAGGERVAGEIKGLFCAFEPGDGRSIATALGKAREQHGQERILANCIVAVLAKRLVRPSKSGETFEIHGFEEFERTLRTNLFSVFATLSQCAGGMAAAPPLGPDNERGVIVNLSSIAAEDGQTGQVAYAAAKAGIAAMALPAARDLAGYGVRVNTVLAGLIKTPAFDSLPDQTKKGLEATAVYPKRLGLAEEYAALVCHICENTLINGATLRLDGAVRLGAK